MLKTVSSIVNALGALNYKGTWNADTNTPTLASGVGVQGDYYVVSVSGSTDLDGTTNWGVGDWAAFNGSIWERLEGGADGNFVNLSVSNEATFPDNAKAIFGDGNDLQIYHNGSNSFIDDAGTGNLQIRANAQIKLQKYTGENMFVGIADGAASMYYDNSQKIATTAAGIDVTGTATMSGSVGIGTDSPGTLLELKESSTGAGDAIIRLRGNGNNANNTPLGSLEWFNADSSGAQPSVVAAVEAQSANANGHMGKLLLKTHDGSGSEADPPTTRMIIDQSGKVGIGTTDPDYTGFAETVLTIASTISNTQATLELVGNQSSSNSFVSGISFHNESSTATEKRIGQIWTERSNSDNDAGNLGFATSTTGGVLTEAMRIDSSQNVGIGTDSPSRNLSLNSSTTTTLQITNDTVGTTTTDGFQLKHFTSGATQVWNYENNYMAFGTNNTERMRIDATGNVGIGTSSPAGLLHISSSAPAFYMTDTTNNTESVISMDNAGSLIFNADLNNEAGSSNIRFAVDGSEAMRIDASGNVGIGTDSPSTELHVLKSGSDADVTIEGTGTGVDARLNLYANSTGVSQIRFGDEADTNIGLLTYDHSDNSMQFRVNDSEAMRIDSSGNVEIKSGGKLQANRADNARNIQLFNDNDFGTIQTSNDPIKLVSPVYTRFDNGGSESMRIDASGNLLVGKTSTGVATAGIELNGANDLLRIARDGGVLQELNRITSDGDLIDFRKDNVSVGSIGVVNTNNLRIGGVVADHAGLQFGTNILIPETAGTASDGLVDIGTGANRYQDVYATNGTIQTSDGNEKQDIEALSDAEQRVAVAAKGLLRKFRWKSAVEAKGDEARTHFGIIAQDLQAAFAAEGLDAGDYGMFINSTWTDEETGEERSRMGVRYSELLAFIISAI